MVRKRLLRYQSDIIKKPLEKKVDRDWNKSSVKITTIRWHARGGQGAMLAVRTLARVAINEGKFAQGMPEFTAERMGAPIRAYNRISDTKFSLYCAIDKPDLVVVLDPTLIGTVDVTEGLSKRGILLINTLNSPTHIREQLKLHNLRVYTVDAAGISQTFLGRPIPNTPMLGAIIKILPVLGVNLKLEGLLEDIQHTFSEKFSSKVVEANIQAVKKGYEEVKGE